MHKNSFDWKWYNAQYSYNFQSESEALEDCIRKSAFADILPIPNFSTRKYLTQHSNVYQANQSHFTANAEAIPNTFQGELWTPHNSIQRTEWNKKYDKKKIAIVIHIYYKEFVRKFSESLAGLPFKINLFITTPFEEVAQECKTIFSRSCKIHFRPGSASDLSLATVSG